MKRPRRCGSFWRNTPRAWARCDDARLNGAVPSTAELLSYAAKVCRLQRGRLRGCRLKAVDPVREGVAVGCVELGEAVARRAGLAVVPEDGLFD